VAETRCFYDSGGIITEYCRKTKSNPENITVDVGLVHLFAAGRAVRFPMASKAPGEKDKGPQNTDSIADAKIHCDEAAAHLKTGNYTKALNGYNLVSIHSSDDMTNTPQGS
jgi:hypothetical protein